jgi:hypothetical protein
VGKRTAAILVMVVNFGGSFGTIQKLVNSLLGGGGVIGGTEAYSVFPLAWVLNNP